MPCRPPSPLLHRSRPSPSAAAIFATRACASPSSRSPPRLRLGARLKRRRRPPRLRGQSRPRRDICAHDPLRADALFLLRQRQWKHPVHDLLVELPCARTCSHRHAELRLRRRARHARRLAAAAAPQLRRQRALPLVRLDARQLFRELGRAYRRRCRARRMLVLPAPGGSLRRAVLDLVEASAARPSGHSLDPTSGWPPSHAPSRTGGDGEVLSMPARALLAGDRRQQFSAMAGWSPEGSASRQPQPHRRSSRRPVASELGQSPPPPP